jgi:hypothetical protein
VSFIALLRHGILVILTLQITISYLKSGKKCLFLGGLWYLIHIKLPRDPSHRIALVDFSPDLEAPPYLCRYGLWLPGQRKINNAICHSGSLQVLISIRHVSLVYRVHTKIEKQLEFSTGKDFLTVNGHVILI